MNTREKQKKISDIQNSDIKKLNSSQQKTIEELSNSQEVLIKIDIARLLADFVSDFSKDILLKFAKDKNSNVRVEAVDTLRFFSYYDVFEELKNQVNDSYYMVRGYAIYSLTRVGINLNINNKIINDIIYNLLKNEKKLFVKLNCYLSLYKLGNSKYLQNILDIFKSNSYRNRCAVINSLYDIISKDNYVKIKEFIEKNQRKEESKAVISSIDELSSFIEQNHGN